MLALAGSRAPSTCVQVPALVIPGTCAYRSWPIRMVLTLISAFGPLAVSWAAALPFGASIEPVIRKPEPDDAVREKLVWSSCSTACDSFAAAAGSAEVVALGVAAEAPPEALGEPPPVVLSPQPATARATVAIVARPSPASRGVRIYPSSLTSSCLTDINSRRPRWANGSPGRGMMSGGKHLEDP